VSVAAATSLRRAHRPVAVATLVAALGGAALGLVLAPDAPDTTDPPPARPQPRIGLRSGPATLPLPTGWRPLRRLSALPGFEEATAVRGLHSELALDIRTPEHASLLPAGVVAAAPDGLPEPQEQRVGGRTAWRYELAGPEPGTRVVALALPTTGGVLTFACEAAAGAIARAEGECGQAARSVRLDGASAVAPAPETAARIVLPGTFAKLNRLRRGERRALAATRSPRRRSAAARRLARGYAAAEARLRPLAAGDALRVTAKLDALARAHRVLAAASLRRKRRVAARAGAVIGRQEARLAALLARLTGPPAAS
jgi:hypothetical protein